MSAIERALPHAFRIEETLEMRMPGAGRYSGAALSLIIAKFTQDLEVYPALANTPLRCRTTGEVDINSALNEIHALVQHPLYERAALAVESNTGADCDKFITPTWQKEPIDLGVLFDILIIYSNPQRESVKKKVGNSENKVAQIYEAFNESKGYLGMEEQLNLINENPDVIWSDMFALALFWREISRKQDESLGMKQVGDDERLNLLKRLPAFPIGDFRAQNDSEKRLGLVGGDYYHMLTTSSLSMAERVIRAKKIHEGRFNGIERMKHGVFDLLLANTDRFAALRNPDDYPYGLHPYADKIGYQTGLRMAQIIT